MSNEKILAEAKDRFHRCQVWESNARGNFKGDMRFGYGDSQNLYQWQGDTVDARNSAGKPCFTVNRTKNYCNQIINDAKQNKAQIEVRPVGNGASFDAAQIMEGICRHIEYISNAEEAYEHAAHDQVFGGIGWWRVCTDYAHDDSFDQEIFIQRVPDSLSIYLDPFIQQADGCDAKFGFVFMDMDQKEFEAQYPRYKDAVSEQPLGADEFDDHWLREGRIRLAEYFRKVDEPDTLHYLENGSTVRESEVEDAGLMDELRKASVRQREITASKVEWYLIAGQRIVSKNVWPGKYIPLVRVIGTETVIDGVLDRAGHVRNLIDPQRSYNYYTSAGIEFVANQTKSPWLADVASIEGVEEYWRDSNLKNFAVLPFKGRGDDGNPIEAPKRADPPVYASAFMDGMKVSATEMEMCSGQPPAAMGETSNERSGKSITERQRAASNSTYHFVNNLSNAIRFTGKILIDLIPRVYDTQRVLKILAQDGTPQTIQVDPNAPQGHQPMQALDGESYSPQQVAAIFNPGVGDFDVVAEIGPQFTTRRQEFVNASLDILAQNESLTPLIGDLVFRSMDFPGATEIADRMRRMVPPQALGTVDNQVTQLQQQLAAQHMLINNLQNELLAAKSKSASTELQKEVDWYKAETERMKAVGSIDPAAMKPIVRQLVSEVLGVPVNSIIAMHAMEDAQLAQQAAVAPLQGMQPDQSQQPQAPQAPGPAQ